MYLKVVFLLVICFQSSYAAVAADQALTCRNAKHVGDSLDTEFKKRILPVMRYLIDIQERSGYTNCASFYNNRPKGLSSLLGIEFDHIPPSKFYKTKYEQDRAPTLSISSSDHYSPLWYQCTTGNPKVAQIFDFYRENYWAKERKTTCAIWANLKCLRDKDKIQELTYKIMPKRAVERYRKGINALIQMHRAQGRIKEGQKSDLLKWVKYLDDPKQDEVFEPGCCETASLRIDFKFGNTEFPARQEIPKPCELFGLVRNRKRDRGKD